MRLYVLHKLPTPYNDDFFRALAAEPGIDLQVFHLWQGSARRPWKSEMGTGYSNYYMRLQWGIDLHTVRLAWNDRVSLFMIGDWAHIPAIALLLIRIIRHSPVALWTDTPQEHLKRPLLKRIPRAIFLQWLLSKVDVIFGSGQPAKRALMAMGAKPEKIIDLQFSVDLERPAKAIQNCKTNKSSLSLRRSVGCEHTGLVFGMSGTIDLSKKAQDIGLRAFAQCCRVSTIPLGLLIAGSGSDLSKLQLLTRELGITDRVMFLGWQEPDDMDAFYMATDVLLHPANYDPFPLVVIEAMSWSKPVIGTNTSGTVEEKVENGINGFSVDPGDIDQMSAAMMRFIQDTSLLMSARNAARKTADTWPMSRLVHVVKFQMAHLLKRDSL